MYNIYVMYVYIYVCVFYYYTFAWQVNADSFSKGSIIYKVLDAGFNHA